MKNREFDPEALRVVGELAWMKHHDCDNWFSVPSSARKIVFSEKGIYVHALTGVRIEILYIDRHGLDAPNILPLEMTNCLWDGHVALFSDILEMGELIFEALSDYGIKLWLTDPSELIEWSKKYAIISTDDGIDVLTWKELGTKVRELQHEYDERERRDKKRREMDLAPKRRARKDLKIAREKWRKTVEYDELFIRVYGKSQNALSDSDPKPVVWAANCVIEYRLRLGKWSDLDTDVSLNSQQPEDVDLVGQLAIRQLRSSFGNHGAKNPEMTIVEYCEGDLVCAMNRMPLKTA